MSGGERLEGPRAEAFISACVAVAQPAVAHPGTFELAVRALEAAYTERPLLRAPTLALDLLALLLGAPLAPVAGLAPGPVRDAQRAYEDHLLARLTTHRRWPRLAEAVQAAPRELRPVAVGVVVAQLLERLALAGGTGVSQAVVRRFAGRPVGEVLEAGRAALFDDALAERLADGLSQLARAARRSRELLTDAEVFLAENVASLQGLGPRVALAQLAETAQAVEEALPARLRTPAREDGEAPTALEEESAYPVGGFTALSTRGSLENLVTSELIYMEEAGAPRPDLFDVRFVEGELLYYARDESVAIRRRRALALVFDPSLLRARVLDEGERFQRLVWGLGAVAALVRKLSRWLDTEALRFELDFVGGALDAPLAEEQAVLRLLLREYAERGQLEVREVAAAGAAVAEARARHRARAQVALLGTRLPGDLEGPARPDVFVDLSAPVPALRWLEARPAGPAPAGPAREAWGAATLALLEGLLRRR